MLLPSLYTISFLDGLSFVMVIVTINPYVLSLGGSQFYLGILGSVSALISLIWNPIVGGFGDSLGRKKVLIYCLLVVIFGNLLAVLTSSLTMFFVSRILTTFGTQIMVFVKSLVDDHVGDTDAKMAAIGRIQALSGICFILGPLVGGYLSEYADGYRIVFELVTAMLVVNLVLALFIPDSQPKGAKNPSREFRILDEIKKAVANLTNFDWPKYWDLFLIKLTVDFVMAVFNFNFAQIVTERFGIKGKFFGYVFASVGIMGIVTNLTMTKVKKYFYEKDQSGLKRLFHGCILLMCVCLGQGLSTSFAVYYVYLILMITVRVIFDTTFTEVILLRAGHGEKGTVMGTFESTMALGGLTAPLISGIISDVWDNNTSILFCIAPSLLGTMVAYTQKAKSKEE